MLSRLFNRFTSQRAEKPAPDPEVLALAVRALLSDFYLVRGDKEDRINRMYERVAAYKQKNGLMRIAVQSEVLVVFPPEAAGLSIAPKNFFTPAEDRDLTLRQALTLMAQREEEIKTSAREHAEKHKVEMHVKKADRDEWSMPYAPVKAQLDSGQPLHDLTDPGFSRLTTAFFRVDKFSAPGDKLHGLHERYYAVRRWDGLYKIKKQSISAHFNQHAGYVASPQPHPSNWFLPADRKNLTLPQAVEKLAALEQELSGKSREDHSWGLPKNDIHFASLRP